jgi:hypothetical protein
MSSKQATKKAPAKQSTPSTETAATTLSAISESIAKYKPGMDKHIEEKMAKAGAELEEVKQALATFATKCKLNPEQQEFELSIRAEFENVERAIFSTTRQRGDVLLKYHALYGPPINKFKAFLAILGMSRATAYRYMAEASGMLEKPAPKAAPKKVSKTVKAYESFKRVLTKGSPKPSAEETDEDKADRVLKVITTFVEQAVKDISFNAQPAFCVRAIREVSDAMTMHAKQVAARLRASADVPLTAEAQADLGGATPREVIAKGRMADL